MSSTDDYFRIRRATPEDAAIIAAHRRLMFMDLGHRDPEKLDAMERQFTDWVRDKLAREEYLAWFTLVEDRVVSGVGLWIREWIINPNDLSGKEGYVGNVYTEREFRRRGCARALMQVLLAWCKEQGIRGLFLRPSEHAGELYTSLGFEPDNALYKRLR